MLPAKLDYLFIATFKDGSRYYQTPSDSSLDHPLTRSAFWDVQQKLDQVRRFSLVDRHHQHEHTVYLDSGHFTSDGRVIAPDPSLGTLQNYRLIYFRRCQATIEGGKHTSNRIAGYFFGWQANDAKGRNYQMILEVPPLGSLKPPQIETK